MTDKIFIDSNIWCYFFLQDEKEKYKTAEKLFSNKGDETIFVISYQVINEVTNKLIQKNFISVIIKESIEYMYKICTIQNFSKDIIITAFELRGKYSSSFLAITICVMSIFSGSINIIDLLSGLPQFKLEVQ